MKYLFSSFFLVVALAATPSWAQEPEEPPTSKQTESSLNSEIVVNQETGLDQCQDKKDNDNDTFIDCNDQDCGIYAICLKGDSVDSKSKEEATPDNPKEKVWTPETGLRCRDGIDNNQDGVIDCHEKSCKHYRYCQKKMYEYPDNPNRPQGLFISTGLGLALPNYRWPSASAPTRIDTGRVPFDPDMGGMMDFKIGYAPLKFLGFGINVKSAVTFATNRMEFFSLKDSDSDYRYIGDKSHTHLGGFVRIMWPFERFVPYLDVSAGFSSARYRWEIYSSDVSWGDASGSYRNDFESFDNFDSKTGEREIHKFNSRHFTMALEPGFDVFVVKRRVAVGARAWLPIFSSRDSSTDNTGLMFTVSFTPTWREKPHLKKEYQIAQTSN